MCVPIRLITPEERESAWDLKQQLSVRRLDDYVKILEPGHTYQRMAEWCHESVPGLRIVQILDHTSGEVYTFGYQDGTFLPMWFQREGDHVVSVPRPRGGFTPKQPAKSQLPAAEQSNAEPVVVEREEIAIAAAS